MLRLMAIAALVLATGSAAFACMPDPRRGASEAERRCRADIDVEDFADATVACKDAARDALLLAQKLCQPDRDYGMMVYALQLRDVAYAYRHLGDRATASRFIKKARVVLEIIARDSASADARREAKSGLPLLDVNAL